MARENSCSKGHDKISVNTIKNCSDQLVAYICMIFNRSIEDGVVPDDLKSVQLPKRIVMQSLFIGCVMKCSMLGSHRQTSPGCSAWERGLIMEKLGRC